MTTEMDKIKVGLLVLVEFKGYLVPGTVMAIDPKSGEVGVRRVFSESMERFPAEVVHTRYLKPNGHQPCFSAPTVPSLKDRNLLRLLGGYIITLSKGESSLETAKEVAEQIQKAGITQEGTKAQDIIASIR